MTCLGVFTPIVVGMIFIGGMFAGLVVASLLMRLKIEHDRKTLVSQAERKAVLAALGDERGRTLSIER